VIPKAAPVLVIEFARGGRHALRFFRCAECDGPAPPDLPPFVERVNTIAPSALHRVGSLLPFGPAPVDPQIVDWKTRAAEGEREPGEEG
jgi:hypothetical protein